MKAQRPYPTITITPKGERALLGGHPWVYDAEITAQSGPIADGAIADVLSAKGRWLGSAFYNSHSKIRGRLISRNANDTFNEAFWRRRLQYAWDYRKSVLSPEDLSCCRVIFGEADAFPGLTVDRFNDILVVQILSLGMEQRKDMLLPALVDLLRADGQTIRGVYERNDAGLREKEGLPEGKGWFPLPGETPPAETVTEIVENGVRYRVDFENGQKTGFFLDQKYNRRAVARLARGPSPCWTASPTPVRLPSTQRWAAPNMSQRWMFPKPLWPWPGKTQCATGWNIAWTFRPPTCSICCPAWRKGRNSTILSFSTLRPSPNPAKPSATP